jgi:hypothetical protein
MGAAASWEPAVAVLLTVATVAALVYFGGRLYVRAILHTGPTLSLRDAWSRSYSSTSPPPEVIGSPKRWPQTLPSSRKNAMPPAPQQARPLLLTVIICAGVALGVVVGALSSDVIIGVTVGAVLIAAATQIIKLWTGHGRRNLRHP